MTITKKQLHKDFFIPYGRQSISNEDIEAVVHILKQPFLTQGPAVHQFEAHLARYVGASYAVATNSATSSLHIACLALGLQEGDELWTSPNSFVASSNAGLYCKANVQFIDIDPKTYNLCPIALENRLKQSSKPPKIVMPVHFSGQSCDMEAIHKLSKTYGFSIIEDASHALGGSYKGNKIGSCEFSDIAVFSFHPVKMITTAEGGMAVTNNRDLSEKMAMLRTHGITKNHHLFSNEIDGPWYYEQQELGLNYRLTDLQSILGISQLKRLDEFVEKRRILAKRYNDLLEDFDLVKPLQNDKCESSWHLYVILIEERKKIFEALRAKNIGVQVHYIPIYKQPFYQTMGFNNLDYPIMEAYYQKALSLPLYPDLTFEEQDYVIACLKEILHA